MATPVELLVEALRAGRYLEAGHLLNAVDRSPENAALVVEAAYYLAQPDRVRQDGRRLLRTPGLTPLVATRTARILGSQLCDDGLLEDGVAAYRLALAKAHEAGDHAEACLATLHLLERTCDYAVFDASLPLASQARRAAARCGVPQVRATAHITFGRLEARAGRYQVARRHFAVARHLLEESTNLRLSAAVDNDEAIVLTLSGNYEEAMRRVRRAAQTAKESGYSKGIVAALCNQAYLLVAQDRPHEAEAHLRLVAEQPFRSAKYDLALTETRALIACRTGSYDLAEELLATQEPRLNAGGRWYEVETDLTRSRILLTLGRLEEALECANAGLEKTQGAGAQVQSISLSLVKAEALIGLGEDPAHADVLFEIGRHSWPVTILGQAWTVLAKALHVVGSDARGAAYFDRAIRLFESIGARAAASDASATARVVLPEIHVSLTAPAFYADSLATLLDLADYPLLLGGEAFAVLERSSLVKAVALVASSESGKRFIREGSMPTSTALRGTTDPRRVFSIPVGEHEGEKIELVAQIDGGFEARDLIAAVERFLGTAAELRRYRNDDKQRAALWPVEAMSHDADLVWASEQVSEVLKIARRVAPTPLSVLLTGETGTGKEMLAREIHRASDRAERTFLPFNCTAVPRDMLESQLFGYRKGAFTGADTSFAGVIRSAAGGTIFLDEIADVPVDVQPKLLRFIETREIHPLGEPHPLTVDVRIVAATNANLERLVAEGRFRDDLFYRLNVVTLKLPPLRERREEIPALVQHYLRRFGDEQKKGQLTLADETLEYLLLYSWPGNIRQLANEVRRMVAMAEPDSTLTPAQLSPELQASRRTIPATETPTAAEAEIRLRLDQPLPVAVETLEQTMIRNALKRSRGRVEEAARLLGISRKGLFLKRRRWNLDHEQAS